ncbi:hypothetical protein [Bradyrhizobium sp. HKCCYLS20291]|uniref:hypothetical protein n=1 Tax=Bradyrhizobium sp. HKCCYLS20291 TaxID=3420766 RepID=UPI003EBAFB9A
MKKPLVDELQLVRNVAIAVDFFEWMRAPPACIDAAKVVEFSRRARQNLPAGLLINTVEILPVCRVGISRRAALGIMRKGRHALR